MPKGDYQRLKADIEDGMVPIAHLLLEALSMARLNGVAKGLVLFIWRRTYGWAEEGKKKYKDDRITLAEFASAVNSERTYVSTQLKLLVRSGVVFEQQDQDNGRYKRYGMNTEIAQWSDKVIDADKLAEVINAKLYVHSSRNVVQTQNGLAITQPFAITKPLSNSTTKPLCKSTTFEADNPSGGAASEASKESKERNKDLKDADDDVPPKPPAEFEQVIEGHMRMRMGNPKYMLVGNDYKALQDMVADGLTEPEIKAGIDVAFERHKPAHKHDRVSSLLYCVGAVYDLWQRNSAKEQVSVGNKRPTNRARAPAPKQRDERYEAFYQLFPDT